MTETEAGASVAFWVYLEAVSTVGISNLSRFSGFISPVSPGFRESDSVSAAKLALAAKTQANLQIAHHFGGPGSFPRFWEASVRRLDFRRIRFARPDCGRIPRVLQG